MFNRLALALALALMVLCFGALRADAAATPTWSAMIDQASTMIAQASLPNTVPGTPSSGLIFRAVSTITRVSGGTAGPKSRPLTISIGVRGSCASGMRENLRLPWLSQQRMGVV